jgi:hypothetical protein
MNEVNGWTIVELGSGGVSLVCSTGFYVAGFDSKVEAGVWLNAFILGQQRDIRRSQERAERARLRILRALPVPGRVS